MSAAKHTPGPWEHAATENGFDIWDSFSRPKSKERILVAQISDDEDEPAMRVGEALANAKLIAAAPMLADALETLLELSREWSATDSEIKGIAKAEAALRAAGLLP